MPLPRLVAALALAAGIIAPVHAADTRGPNIVLIVADDLGYGELGSYGQTRIETPHLDRLAREGMRFTQHYAGAPVCAPSRCVLLTGRHSAHAAVRDNQEFQPEGQLALPDAEITIAERLRDAGYASGGFGKWGLGGPGTEGAPERQGFDRFVGYLCQRQAHNFYPTHLWADGVRLPLANRAFRPYAKLAEAPDDPSAYDRYQDAVYAPDVMLEHALAFMEEHADQPFFLYYPSPIPHVALQIPDADLARYAGRFDETPYLGQKGYVPHPTPRAAYAAMITRLDAEVGRLLARLDALGLADDTLVLFTSDNGPTYAGGVDYEFFASAGDLRGLKGSVFEGGLRVPLIARWPEHVRPGTVTRHPSAFPDITATLCDVAGVAPLSEDGISFLPTLEGDPGAQREHEALIFEFPGYGGQIAVRAGRWKLVRRGLLKTPAPVMLFDLDRDPGETTNLADRHPTIVAQLDGVFHANRTPSAAFPIPALDERVAP